MIKNVVREHHWLPNYVNSFYMDDSDHLGLDFWSEDIRQCHAELTAKTPGKKTGK